MQTHPALEAKEFKEQAVVRIFDIDETFILSKRENGDPVFYFNEPLIQALKESGTEEIYLLSSLDLREPDPNDIYRLELIKHLEAEPNGIKVLGLLTNWDLVPAKKLLEEKDIATLPESITDTTCIPGIYYEKVIKPVEQMALSNRTAKDKEKIDIPNHPQYKDARKRQDLDPEMGAAMLAAKKKGDLKESLAQLLFSQIRNKCKSNNTPMPRFEYFDDRDSYLKQLEKAAKAASEDKESAVEMRTFHVNPAKPRDNKDMSKEDYLLFIDPYALYKKMATENTPEKGPVFDFMLSMHEKSPAISLSLGKKSLFHHETVNSDLEEQLKKVLDCYEMIQKDLQRPREKQDPIGACNALIAEIDKRIKELEKLLKHLSGFSKITPSDKKNREFCEGAIRLLSSQRVKVVEIGMALEDKYNPGARQAREASKNPRL